MIISKVRQHFDENLKNSFRKIELHEIDRKISLTSGFCNFENRNDENISFSCEENWGKFVINGTLNRKIGSGRSRASTIKHDHRLKMNVLKGIRKCLLSTANIQNTEKKFFSRLKKFR